MEVASEVAGPLGLLPPSHPLYLGIRRGCWENPEMAQTASILPLWAWLVGGQCREGVQGLMRNRLWGCGPADQHFCGSGLAGIYPHPADPDSSPSLGGVGVSPTGSAVLSCPLRWLAGTALGNRGRKTHVPSPSLPNMFCKGLWNPWAAGSALLRYR